ncbi:MAG: nitroreductase [Pseudomonadota bacterium]
MSDLDVVEKLLATRYSCRAFKPDEVPRATIERVLSAAQKTASWCNSQPWQVTIFSGEAARKFSEDVYKAASSGAGGSSDFPFPREYKGVYLERRRESGFQLYNALGIARGDKAAYQKQMLENFRFFGAPHVAIVTTAEELGVYGAIDCGGYVSNFMLAAQAAGLATVPQAALAGYSDVVRKHLGAGDERKVVCGISFGFADSSHKANSYRTTRATIPEAVHFLGG